MNGYGSNGGYGQSPFDNRGGYSRSSTGNQRQRSRDSSDNQQGMMPHNVSNANPQFNRNNNFFGQPLDSLNHQGPYQQSMYRPLQSPTGLVTLGNWHQQSRDDQPPPPPPRYDPQFAPAQQWNQGYNASGRSQLSEDVQGPPIAREPWDRIPLAPQTPRFQQSLVDRARAPPGSGNSIPHQQFEPSRSDWNNNFVNGSQDPDNNSRDVGPAPRTQGRRPPPSFHNQRRQISNDQLPRSRVVHSGRIAKSNRHTVQKLKSGQATKPRAELICAWCDQKGHPVRDCNSKVDAYGYIGCCPRCNKKHSYDDCDASEKVRRPNDDTHFLVERRAGKPLVYTRKDVRTILGFREYSEGKGYPIAPITALRLASEGYFNQTRYSEKWSDDQKYTDPAWAVEDGRHIAPRGGLAHPLALQRYEDLHAKDEGSDGVQIKKVES